MGLGDVGLHDCFGDGFPELIPRFFGVLHGFFAHGGDFEISFGAAGAFFGAFAGVRFEVSFFLHAFECGMECAEAYGAFEPRFDFVLDGDAVRLVIENSDGKDDDFLEFAELVFLHAY